jgi:CheY-like chemotaxis protein
LVKALVELHGGSVEAHSAGPGKGSEFIVRLALAAEAQRSQQSKNVLTTAPKAKSVARRILIVDDNVDAAESLADLLSSFGHDVQIAFDGPTALATASVFRPEVIFLDIGMPGMDGYQVVHQLRKQNGLEKTMIVALTGYGRDVDRQRTQDAGFDAHLVKPIDLDTLNNILSMRGERC